MGDQFPRSTAVARFNTAFALKITAAVGSMWCAYIFAAIAIFGLPSAVHNGLGGIVQWIAQTFLQLVLLSIIIIVGQNVQAGASDERAENTYQDAEAVLHEEPCRSRSICSPRIRNCNGLSPPWVRPGDRNTDYDWMKSSRSALMVSASVVGMPWGKPGYVLSVPFCTSLADSGPESA